VKDSALLAALIAFAVAVLVVGVAMVVGLRFRRRIFAGPARDAWNLTRHDLSTADQRRVLWATSFRRPVSRGRLAPAQLVYSRYAQYTAERSPLNRKSFRIGLAVLYLALAAYQVGNGVTSRGRVLDFVIAADWAVLAVMFGLVVPWASRRMPVKLKRLRRKIRARYPDDWA
jgi:hypothetical protein